MEKADSVKNIIEKKYLLGAATLHGPFIPNHAPDAHDCLSYIVKFYGDIGYKFPSEYKGWTLQNYAKRWAQGEGREIYTEFLHSLGREVELNYMIEGDLILLDLPEYLYPCIFLGSGHVLLVTIETGPRVIPLDAVKKKIKEVRRLIDG